ncbi:hypothetical protein CTI12_AA450350 [Artemisia annua]|uniref:Uncharacterized protein n=1 Tax=Artemisia annua TaxID=35608 RepID=A0A2U1LV69_ARTAN|nr:hypothetical protein CTI12_AA450350 [Artemisia annua]
MDDGHASDEDKSTRINRLQELNALEKLESMDLFVNKTQRHRSLFANCLKTKNHQFVGPITPTVLALRDELFTVPYHNIDWNEARNMLVAGYDDKYLHVFAAMDFGTLAVLSLKICLHRILKLLHITRMRYAKHFVVPSEIHKRLYLARKSNLGTHTNISAKKAQEIQMPKHGKEMDKIIATEKVEKVKMMLWLNFLTIGEKEVKFSPGSCSRLRRNDSRKRSTRTDLSCRLLSANYLSNMEDFSYVRAYLDSSHTLSKR